MEKSLKLGCFCRLYESRRKYVIKSIKWIFMVGILMGALFWFSYDENVYAIEIDAGIDPCPADNQTSVEDSDSTKNQEPEYIIKQKHGQKYCYDNHGKKIKNQFVTVKEHTYYFGKSGSMKKGWMKLSGKYYYLDRKTGKQKFNCKVDGIQLKKDGAAKKTEYNYNKIKTMITAREIMEKNTKSSDTKSQKLKKCFMWVMKHPYKRYRTIREARAEKGWEMTFANDVYKKGNGCCVSEACAFSFLANECGYKNVYVCDDTGHAWTEINGKVYDTLFAEAKNGASYENPDFYHYYNATYKRAGLYHGPLMGRKRI